MTDQEFKELRHDVTDIKFKIGVLTNLTEQRLTMGQKIFDDHERRLRFLERYAFILVGVIGIVSTFINFLKG